MDAQDRAILEAFVVENRDLEQLESLLAEFNIFEAIGAVQQELRHSDFLAYMLDPAQSHGLGDVFLKRLLKRVLVDSVNPPLSAIEIDVADLHEAAVWREWRHVDILIHDAKSRLVCVIENKIGSGEHSDQLARYRKTVNSEFPDDTAVLIYLTPEGDTPSDEAYTPFSYGQIAELIDTLRQTRQSTLGPDVRTLMAHYTAMLRRYIVSESEITQLCQKIYRQHKQAIDLIFEYRPDLQWDLTELIKELIAESPDLVLDHDSKSYPKFRVSNWDSIPAQRTGQGWTRSRRILLFEFQNAPDSLTLRLIIGPGPMNVRQAVYEITSKHPQIFRGGRKKLSLKWTTVYQKRFLTSRDYRDADFDTLATKVRKQWSQFLDQDLPSIRDTISKVAWPEI